MTAKTIADVGNLPDSVKAGLCPPTDRRTRTGGKLAEPRSGFRIAFSDTELRGTMSMTMNVALPVELDGVTDPVWGRLYREIEAGGYSRVAGTVAFYLRLASLTPEGGCVLDLGAGRNRLHESGAADVLLRIIDLPRHTSRLVGADVDDAVMDNRFVKERVVFDPAKPLPFADNEFDVVYSDWVLEHVEQPQSFATEVRRIIKPGGWFCARTPNKWGISGLGSRLMSTAFKKMFIEKSAGARTSDDVFPTFYRLNSLETLGKYFPNDLWKDYSYISNSEPPYVRNMYAAYAVLMFWRIAPQNFATNIFCLKRKR